MTEKELLKDPGLQNNLEIQMERQKGRKLQFEKVHARFETLTEEMENECINGRIGSQFILHFKEWKELNKQLELNSVYREEDINLRERVMTIIEMQAKKNRANFQRQEAELKKKIALVEKANQNSLRYAANAKMERNTLKSEQEMIGSDESGIGGIENSSTDEDEKTEQNGKEGDADARTAVKEKMLVSKLQDVEDLLKRNKTEGNPPKSVEDQELVMSKENRFLREQIAVLSRDNERLRKINDDKNPPAPVSDAESAMAKREAELAEREKTLQEQIKEHEDNNDKFITQFDALVESEAILGKKEEKLQALQTRNAEQLKKLEKAAEKSKSDEEQLLSLQKNIKERERSLAEKLEKLERSKKELEQIEKDLKTKEAVLQTDERKLQVDFKNMNLQLEKEKKEIDGMKAFCGNRDLILRSWAKSLMEMKDKLHKDKHQLRNVLEKLLVASDEEVVDPYAQEHSTSSEELTTKSPFDQNHHKFPNKRN